MDRDVHSSNLSGKEARRPKRCRWALLVVVAGTISTSGCAAMMADCYSHHHPPRELCGFHGYTPTTWRAPESFGYQPTYACPCHASEFSETMTIGEPYYREPDLILPPVHQTPNEVKGDLVPAELSSDVQSLPSGKDAGQSQIRDPQAEESAPQQEVSIDRLLKGFNDEPAGATEIDLNVPSSERF